MDELEEAKELRERARPMPETSEARGCAERRLPPCSRSVVVVANVFVRP